MSVHRVPVVAGRVFLHPGDVAIGERDVQLITLLGSCIAVLLADPKGQVGAMCHLVHAGEPISSVPGTPDGCWGGRALPAMFALMRTHGVQLEHCAASVIGGGHYLPEVDPAHQVGTRNASWTMEALAAAGIPVVHQDLGGCVYRRLSWRIGEMPEVQRLPMQLAAVAA